MKIRLMGNELFRWDGRTDRQTEVDKQTHEKPNSRFSQFCETRLKIGY